MWEDSFNATTLIQCGDTHSMREQNKNPTWESSMRLHLISSAVVVYTALATACICYAGV